MDAPRSPKVRIPSFRVPHPRGLGPKRRRPACTEPGSPVFSGGLHTAVGSRRVAAASHVGPPAEPLARVVRRGASGPLPCEWRRRAASLAGAVDFQAPLPPPSRAPRRRGRGVGGPSRPGRPLHRREVGRRRIGRAGGGGPGVSPRRPRSEGRVGTCRGRRHRRRLVGGGDRGPPSSGRPRL